MNTKKEPDQKLTRDPISGASENHPVGTGVGALGGAVAGAAIGSALGPIGSLTGAVVGTVAGAIAGKGIAEGINPEAEAGFWRENFRSEHYYKAGTDYNEYGPAYRLGWEKYSPDTSFDSVEEHLSEEWKKSKDGSALDWQEAKEAARASWERVHHTKPRN